MTDREHTSEATSGPMPKRRGIVLRIVFGFVCFITLVALFYAVENWRGHRAWIRYKAELAGRGEEMEWAAFIPPNIPDDQNFMKAPLMDAWFRKYTPGAAAPARLQQLASGPALMQFSQARHAPEPLLEVDLAQFDGSAAEGNNTLASFVSDHQFESVVRETGAVILMDPRGSLILAAGPKAPLKRIHLQLANDNERTQLNKVLEKAGFELRSTEAAGRFQLVNASAVPARDVLDYFGQFDPEFAELYKACERPYAHFEGDSTDPFSIPTPNFVNFRSVAQVLGAKATAELFNGHPDQAFREVHTLLRLMDALSSAQPTLVTMMIRVAIGGLTVDLVKTGMDRNLWREGQYIAIQHELTRLDFLSDVARALRGGERAGMNFILEKYSRAKLRSVLEPENKSAFFSFLAAFTQYTPRGWVYQNQVALSAAYQAVLDTIDLNKFRIDSAALDQAMARIASDRKHRTVYNLISDLIIPNVAKAYQTAAKNQTLVGEARIGCALERFRAARGEYPETLANLSPTYIDKLPHELTTGGDLQYRREGKESYELYSVGWNREDEGGLPGSDRDWVWSSGSDHAEAEGRREGRDK